MGTVSTVTGRNMAKRTPLYEKHLQANGKMVDFGGWDMPVNYGSQIQEHQAVRQHAGMFDVSHMTIVDVRGVDATAYPQKLLANDVAKLKETGKARKGITEPLSFEKIHPAARVVKDIKFYSIALRKRQ